MMLRTTRLYRVTARLQDSTAINGILIGNGTIVTADITADCVRVALELSGQWFHEAYGVPVKITAIEEQEAKPVIEYF